MLVQDCMTRHPVMISPDTSLPKAQQVMAENHIHHLPVVLDGKKLAGLITPECLAMNPDLLGSLNVWEITRNLGNMRAKQVMIKAKHVVSITADRSVERAASIMLTQEVGCLPVLDEDNAVLGIVTRVDLLRALQDMLAIEGTGVRVTIRIHEKKREFNKLMDLLAENNWGVNSIGTYAARRRPGQSDVVMKIADISLDEAKDVLASHGPYEIVDIRPIDADDE